MAACNAKDTMLQLAEQLLLTVENHHFEDSMHRKAKVETRSGPKYVPLPTAALTWSQFFVLGLHAALELMVLHRQEELVGPPQHGIIHIT